MNILEWVAIGSLTANLGMLLIGLKIKADLTTSEIALERKIDQGDAELRESQREIELYMRDNFVRTSSFDQIIKLISADMKSQFERLHASVDRLSDKLDRKNGHDV